MLPLYEDEMAYYGISTVSTTQIVTEVRRSSRSWQVFIMPEVPSTTMSKWGNTGSVTLAMPMGWKEVEEKGTTARVKKAKKKRVENEKEIKRLTMGPKASRWR
jgi:hypothetical protein